MNEITERDFRMPEFVDADPADFERRQDGKIVRKDRWIRAVHKIASMVGCNIREFEIDEVVGKVEHLCCNHECSQGRDCPLRKA